MAAVLHRHPEVAGIHDVWLIEDSRLEAEMAANALGSDWRIRTFGDGLTPLELMSSLDEQALPHLLLVDWHLPDLRGPEICAAVRERFDEVTLPILMMTGVYKSSDHLLEALNAGANDFIRKPYEPAELRARASHLARLRTRRAPIRDAEEAHRLMAMVTHDLRNPVNAILLGASTLAQRVDPESRELWLLKRILSSAERSSRLIHDLLDFSRARLGGGLPIVCRPCDLAGVVETAVHEVKAARPELDIVIAGDGAPRGQWDADRIVQAIENLLLNAATYGDRGAPITITLGATQADATISVHNRGPAIPEGDFARLFEPLQRGPKKGREHSIGMGLFIVDLIARGHGGRVTVTSTEADGTMFTLHLPL